VLPSCFAATDAVRDCATVGLHEDDGSKAVRSEKRARMIENDCHSRGVDVKNGNMTTHS
jgi:hypothetical protein